MNWVHPSRGEFLRNAVGHLLDIRADLDSASGIFRRHFAGRVVDYGNYNRVHGRGELGRDLAILQLLNPQTRQPECLGDAYRAPIMEYRALENGLMDRINIIHLFKVSENRARVFVNAQSCRTIASLAAGGVQANCRLRDGASGSVLFAETSSGPSVMIGLAANETSRRGEFYAAGAVAIDEVNRIMRRPMLKPDPNQPVLTPDAAASFVKDLAAMTLQAPSRREAPQSDAGGRP
jgi:hypothetical protein